VLENVGSAVGRSYMNDVVEFVETSKTDFIKYTKNLFKRLIQNFQKVYYYRPERPTKSFFGFIGVHESLLKSLIEAYIVLVEETVNEAIIPACVVWVFCLWVVIFSLTTNRSFRLKKWLKS
jgi:hypothetical protein